MDPKLVKELSGAIFKNVPQLVQDVFPDHTLPLPTSDLLSSLSSGPKPLYRNHQWLECPRLDRPSSFPGDKEHQMACFFNEIYMCMSASCRKYAKRIPKGRKWTVHTRGSSRPAGSSRNPDLLLFQNADGTESWYDAISQCNLRWSDSAQDSEAAIGHLTNDVSRHFRVQDDWLFRLSLSICATKVSLLLFDRAGLIASEIFDIHESPELLVRILAGMMLSDISVIGADPSVETDGLDKRFIEAGGKRYWLVHTNFTRSQIRGRGTVCWLARCDGRDYVIKDFWCNVSSSSREEKLLEMVKGIDGVPDMVWHGAVAPPDFPELGSTARWRSRIDARQYPDLKNLETLEHRRIIITPFAKPITSFSSKRELLSAVIDIVKGPFIVLSYHMQFSWPLF